MGRQGATPAVRATAVGKRYGRGAPWILDGVDLELPAGALVRIAGPNGSGKSTLLKLVAGIEPPSRGRIEVAGRRAYVPERFPPALPFDAVGYLRHLGRIQGRSAASAAERADHWLERFGVADRTGTPLRRLSKGTCQKVAVAQALLADADVLVLDEAWTGLDQAARTVLDEAAAERAAGGALVLFVDHDPGRLAGATTAAYQVGGGALTVVGAPVECGPEELMVLQVDLAGEELPARLPGAPTVRRLREGRYLLRVPARHSDALLRRLPAGPPAAHVLDVRRAEVPAADPGTDPGAETAAETGPAGSAPAAAGSAPEGR
ncbi:ATP-binding cassette domain-containing protein [Kitasatospora nipponensis]|uniref:ATP-binding cassette domain-containing protein n=1 Tax=Kitasatospora nipponensis TaxID=258049 RepID=A0ABN1WI93_9ACTN